MTSGGDAPGMNAIIRAVVRTACANKIEVKGIKRGYEGLLSGDIIDMNARSVSEIIQRGGTMLLTARSTDMMTPEGQEKAANICRFLGLDALVVAGGDGSTRGALALSRLGVNTVCIPATIDLDLPCSDYTIGFDSAVNTAMEAITKIRDTSSSHERCSVVEVMGRDSGYLALWCAMTGGAEDVLLPELSTSEDEVIRRIIENRARGKRHNLVVVAEGMFRAVALAKKIQDMTGIETRPSILGYLQRGGAPSALDRVHASMMGYEAVKLIMEKQFNKVVIFKDGAYSHMDIEEGLKAEHKFNDTMYHIARMLAI
ncbi:MAG: 6-phosphofructokinase [Defluviitaleaceae bacterium]|nr:6-phosphofructokinase [Defluviitaleaceae bacterium]